MRRVAKLLGLISVTAAIVLIAEIPGFSQKPWNPLPPVIAQTESAEARLAEANRLLQQGIENFNHSQFREALQTWEQALAVYRESSVRQAFPQESRSREADILRRSGVAYSVLNEIQEAIRFYEQSLAIDRELGNRIGEGITLGNLGNVYQSRGNTYAESGEYQQSISFLKKSVDFYRRSLSIARENTDAMGERIVMGNLRNAYQRLCSLYSNLEQYQDAVESCEQHLIIVREIGDRLEEGQASGNLGVAYAWLGEYEKAINYFEQTLVIARDLNERRLEGMFLGNLGYAYQRLGRYRSAFDFYQESLVISRESGDHLVESQTLSHLGDYYTSLGDYQQGIKFLEQSLNIAREINDRSGEGRILRNLGNAHANLGQLQDAINFYQQNLAITRENGSRFEEGRTLGNLGIIYRRLGRYQQSLEYYEQSLDIAREFGFRAGEANVLGNMGVLYRRLGQYEQAINFYQQTLAITREINYRAGEGQALGNLGELLAIQNQSELAILFLKASVDIRESIRGDIRSLDTALQQSFTDTVDDTYRTLADLLLARGEILEAQRVLELLKVQELQDFTRSRVTNVETRDYELDPAEKAVIDAHTSLVAFGLKRSECVVSPDCSAATLRDLDIEYEQLSDAYTQAVNQLTTQRRAEQEARRAQADGQLLQARQELSPEGFAGTAGVLTRNHPGTVLVYPVVLEDKLWVLWGSAGGVVSAIEVPAGRERIGDAVLRFRQLMTACELGGCDARDIPAVQAVAQELYQYLIPAPLEEELQALQATLPEGQVPNLVIVPDLVTRYIPFAALHDGQQYLIEKYAISTLLGAEQTTADNPLTTLDSTSILGLGLSNPVPEHGFPFPLENVPTELAAIVQTSATEPGIFRGETHLNDAFDLDKLRLARRHQVLHLATHGVFDPKADSLSFLMLGVGQPLYIRDLQTAQDYFQNLSLVVLSACETALSDIDQSGLELASIASTFLQARVDTVVASLWQVSDSATSDLMQQFYGSLAQSTPEQRVSVGQALRQAQLAMLYGNEAADGNSRATVAIEATGSGAEAIDLPRTAHPYYWSPFTIIGNGL